MGCCVCGAGSAYMRKDSQVLVVAQLSADLAWSLLTPEQQKMTLEYLEKVREWETNQETYGKQEKSEGRRIA